MADIWTEYNAAIAAYSNSDYMCEILESVWIDTNCSDYNFSLIDTLIPGETTLLDVLEKLTTLIAESPVKQDEIYNVNLRQFMGLLSIALHIPDVDNSEESAVLKNLISFFNFINSHSENLLETNENCMATYSLGIKKLEERHKQQFEITSTFFINYNEFIETQNMDFSIASSTLQFLIDYGSSYRNMIQNLSIYNKTCSPGFLSFVCLSTLILRKHTDKKKFLIYLFNLISAKLSSCEGMTEMQTGIMNSNFQLLIRQVGQQMLDESDDIVLALLRVGPYYSNVKPIALLINQLPFSLYTSLIKILQKLISSVYKPERQEFAFSLLESPYITCDGDQEDHFFLTKLLIKSVISPLRSGISDDVKRTVVFINKILKLQDQTTQEALRIIITEEEEFSISNILNYTFEKTNPFWDKNSIQMNESFISMYCNLLLLNYEMPWNNFLQLEEIINSSDVITLIPSIPLLINILKKALHADDELTYLIGATLVTNALSPNMQYSRYLQALYQFMFEDGNEGKLGIEISNVLSSYGVKIKNLISKMYIQQYFKPPTLCKLFNHINDKKGLQLIDTAIHIIDAPIIPGILLHRFCMDFIANPLACMDENLNTLCSILTKVAEASYEPLTLEWNLLQAFLNFIETNLINRMFPIGLLKATVITTKKLKDKFYSSYANLLRIFRDIGTKIIAVGKEDYDGIDPQFITRDIYYYSEFAIIFGEKPGFKLPNEVVEVLGNYLSLPIKDILKQEELSNAVLKSGCILISRREDLTFQISKVLNKLVYIDNENIQVTALHCLHDLAVLKSQHFDSLITPICHFMKSTSHKLQIDGLQLFMKLVDKEYIIPNYWQLYCLTYIIAREYKLVEVEIGKLVIYNFINTLAKCYEQYFINIVLYFNNYYDHQIYPLKSKDLTKIPTKQVPLDRREAVYKLILRSFSNYTYHKILNHIYNALFRNMFLSSMTYAKSYELVQDVMTITLIVLKQSHFTYAKGNLILYCHTIERVKNLEECELNRSKIPETDNDHTIKNVVSCLIDLMKVADGRIKFIMPELMHVLLAICEWYFDNICNIILNEKNKGFYNTVKSFPALYKSFRHLIHSPTFDTPPTESTNTTQFYRI